MVFLAICTSKKNLFLLSPARQINRLYLVNFGSAFWTRLFLPDDDLTAVEAAVCVATGSEGEGFARIQRLHQTDHTFGILPDRECG